MYSRRIAGTTVLPAIRSTAVENPCYQPSDQPPWRILVKFWCDKNFARALCARMLHRCRPDCSSRVAAPETIADFKRWNLSLSVDISSFRPGAGVAGSGLENLTLEASSFRLVGPAAGLGLGCRTLDFWFWSLDCRFRILDFGFWILGFGLWIELQRAWG